MKHIGRWKGNELLTISNGEPPPRSRPLPTIPFPLSGATEEEDCTTAVYEAFLEITDSSSLNIYY
ncbi:hypothetical protein GBAR_LOCUS18401 [Geodia barretti]|uniref:Uncharacterized protein n=1 Tax=Geodia barretti TaxID=519541 RepID=A0AA35SNX5_GEOBA|nr:hypothetical protein GBAR_LOCUS18401 [Geodia barretti]